MKVGDLVRVKNAPKIQGKGQESREKEGKMGVIIDFLETKDGFNDFEVMFENGPGWFADLELEVISER